MFWSGINRYCSISYDHMEQEKDIHNFIAWISDRDNLKYIQKIKIYL